jgi:hypothetical protein
MLTSYILQSLFLGVFSYIEAMYLHPVLTFIINSFLVMALYNIWEQILYNEATVHYDPRKISYISTNVVKSNYLLGLCPICLFLLLNFDDHDIQYVKNLGAIYAAIDFAALFYNKRMTTNTIIHHITVVLFFVLNLFDTYKDGSISKMIMIYAIFSTFAYLVNFCLGLRLMFPIPGILYRGVFFLYFFLCIANWKHQFEFMFEYFERPLVKCYGLLLFFVIYDDMVLLQWLSKKTLTM